MTDPLQPLAPVSLPAQPAVKMRAFGDAAALRERLYSGVLKAAQNIQPIANKRYTLKISDVDYTSPDTVSKAQWKKAILSGGSLTRKLTGKLSLIDNETQEPVSVRTMTLANVPHITDDNTVVHNGTAYSLASQLRQLPGVYARRKQNGELESHFNVIPGQGWSHRIFMQPDTGVFKMRIGQAELPLLPILRALGANDSQIRDAWGNELTQANLLKDSTKTLTKLHDKLVRNPQPGTPLELQAKSVADALRAMKISPDVTKQTLGEAFENIDLPIYLAATKKLIAINKGEAEPDDRDSPAFQAIHGPEDHLSERVTKDHNTLRQLLWKATAKQSLDHLNPGVFDKTLKAALLGSGLSQPLTQINPLETLDQATKVTKLGAGGISDADAVPAESRNVGVGQHSFIDYLRTPESQNAGVDLRLANTVMKGEDNRLYAPMRDLRTGNISHMSPQQMLGEVVTFPGEMTSGEPYVRAIKGGNLELVPREEATLVSPFGENQFSALGNLIPLKSHLAGQRMVMGSRMLAQALPLDNAEAPLVRAADPNNDGKSFEESLGKHAGAIRADKPGVVTKITDDNITLKHPDGTVSSVELANNMPFNQKSVSGDTVVVVRRRNGKMWRGCIKDYQQGGSDKILSYDPLTKLSAWKKITGFIRHKNNKRMFEVVTDSGRNVVVTEDHSLVTLNSVGELSPLYPEDCVVNNTRLPWVRIPDTQPVGILEDWQRGCLAGLYLSEGHCAPVHPGHVEIAVKPERRARQIMSLLVNMGYNPHRNGKASVNFTDHKCCDWLVSTFGHLAHNKRIPSIVFNESKSFLRGLIQGYMAGDGCLSDDINAAIQVSAVSVSKQLRDDFLDLLSVFSIFTTLFDAPRAIYNDKWRDGFGFRVTSSHLSKLDRWFFYDDREKKFRKLLKSKYRASPYDSVPVVDKLARKTLYKELGTGNMYLYKTAGQGFAAKRHISTGTGNYGKWGRSDIMWDKIVDVREITAKHQYVYDFSVDESQVFAVCNGLLVHNTTYQQTPAVTVGQQVFPGHLLARSNYTDDQGHIAVGKNARTAYTTFHGKNYEDAIVISQSMANRMTSQHAYQHPTEWTDKHKTGMANFVGIFPRKYNKAQLDKFDDNGVIKPGSKVEYGDPLILAARESEPLYGQVHRGRKSTFVDDSITWNHHNSGVVTDAVPMRKGANVVVRSTHAMKTGDKLSGLRGDKGVIHVVSDDQMPTDDKGQPYEVLLNPLGLISRKNPAQLIDAALGRVAAITGKPYNIKDWDEDDEDARDHIKFAENELAKHGLKLKDDIYDPETGRKIGNVFVGNRWFMKLHHEAESKAQGRGVGSYSAEGLPMKGGVEGAKRVGMLQLGALLSHGAAKVIQDVKLVKGQANPEYWSQVASGYNPKMPGTPFVYRKFIASLQGAGINPVRQGTQTHLMALTDKDVDRMAEDRELQNTDTVDWAKGQKPAKGGLFDESIFGDKDEEQRWGKITLHEPMPNPVMEEPIRRTLGLTENKFREILAGREKLQGITGPKAIQSALSSINLPKAIDQARAEIQGTKKGARDAAIRRLGYLKDAQRIGLHPKDWMLSKMPVLPPGFRPVTTLGATKMPLVADANYLYHELFHNNKNLKELSAQTDDVSDERLAVYDAMKGLTGLGDPTHVKNQERGVKGLLKQIFGTTAKLGLVQRKLLGTPVDLVGRAVIVPDPDLDMDQVGIPEDKAWDVYKPFVVGSLVKTGMSRLAAASAVENRSDSARQALLSEMDSRPILIDRAPSLHRFSVMAAWPRLVKDDTMHINPTIIGGFSGDFDGDAMNFSVPASPEAVKEAAAKMLPSHNLFSIARLTSAQYKPTQEYLGGLHTASTAKSDKPVVVFDSAAAARAAYYRGEIGADQIVDIRE